MLFPNFIFPIKLLRQQIIYSGACDDIEHDGQRKQYFKFLIFCLAPKKQHAAKRSDAAYQKRRDKQSLLADTPLSL
jgi:hypothetical protein